MVVAILVIGALLVINIVMLYKCLLALRRAQISRGCLNTEIQEIRQFLQKWDVKYANLKRWHDTVAPILRRKDGEDRYRNTHDAGNDHTCPASVMEGQR